MICALTPGCRNRLKHDDPDECKIKWFEIRWEIALLIGALVMGG